MRVLVPCVYDSTPIGRMIDKFNENRNHFCGIVALRRHTAVNQLDLYLVENSQGPSVDDDEFIKIQAWCQGFIDAHK